MTDLHIPDLSQHQAQVDFSKVGPAVILRAHNGNRPDATFKTRQQQARANCTVIGYYGYVVADRDAATQGREFATTVGALQPGEFAVCDLETGDGDQSARAEAWCQAADRILGGIAWVYTGLAFRADHLAHVTGRRWWIAAYRATEPAGDHVLWQHSDSEQHPGIGPCDCSIYRGTVTQLRDLISPPRPAATHPAAHTAVVPTQPVQEDDMIIVNIGNAQYLVAGGKPVPLETPDETKACIAQGAVIKHLPEAVVRRMVGQ